MLLRVPAGASSTISLRDPRHGAGGSDINCRISISLAGGSFLLDLKHSDSMTLLIMYLFNPYQFLLLFLFLQPYADMLALLVDLRSLSFFFRQFSLEPVDFLHLHLSFKFLMLVPLALLFISVQFLYKVTC